MRASMVIWTLSAALFLAWPTPATSGLAGVRVTLQEPSREIQLIRETVRSQMSQMPLIFSRNLKRALSKFPDNVMTELKHMSPNDVLRAMPKGNSNELMSAVEAVQGSVLDTVTEIIRIILRVLGGMLDPLYLGNYNMNVSQSDLNATISVEFLKISHLLQAEIKKNSLTIKCLEADILQPEVTVQGYYDINAKADIEGNLIHVFGNGPMRVDLYNTSTHAELCIVPDVEAFSLELKNLHILSGGVKIFLANIFGGGEVSELINGVANDVTPAVIREIEPEASKLIMEEINKLLRIMLPVTNIIQTWQSQ